MEEFKIEEINLGLCDLPGHDPAGGRLAALSQIAECLKAGKMPPQELSAYFVASVKRLAAKHAEIDPAALPPEKVMEMRQRAISSAFEYTRGAGKPKADTIAERNIARDIYRIMQRKNCGDDDAVEAYINDDKILDKRHASFDHLRKLYYRYKPVLIIEDAEAVDR